MSIDSNKLNNSKMHSLKSDRTQLRQQRSSAEQQLKEVSAEYEKYFLGEMMKAMRSTVSHSDVLQQSQGEKIFREQLDQEYVNKWGAQGGIGLSELIYKQMVEKFGDRLGITQPENKPIGPIPMDYKSLYTAKVIRNDDNKMSYQFERKALSAEDLLNKKTISAEERKIINPWSGVLLNKIALGDDQMMNEVQHDNGMKSQFVFKGTSFLQNTGDRIEAGQKLGLLSPEANRFFWNVQDATK